MYSPFLYNESVYGGTEYMARNFLNKIYSNLPKLENYLCLILPGTGLPLSEIIKDGRKIILWLHNTPTQFDLGVYRFYFSNPKFWERVKYVVVPSETAKHYLLRDVPNVNPNIIKVISNAIYPVDVNPSKFDKVDKVKIIHTSSIDRGMPILMEALKHIDDDFTLEVYNDFNPDLRPDIEYDDRVTFFGRTPRNAVQKAFESAHIFAYPSIFEETFCLSLAEGMSAGCLPVYSNTGAVEEISGARGLMYKTPETLEEHIDLFAKKLSEAISTIKSGNWNPEEQIEYINNKFSWEAIEKQWLDLHELL